MNEKKCSKCKKVKPLTDFYEKNGKPWSRCKNCWRSYMAEKGRREPHKRYARATLNYCVKVGHIKKPASCSKCKATNVEIHGHHADYSKPLEVKWLCPLCHKREHARLKRLGKEPQEPKEHPLDKLLKYIAAFPA